MRQAIRIRDAAMGRTASPHREVSTAPSGSVIDMPSSMANEQGAGQRAGGLSGGRAVAAAVEGFDL